MKSFLPFVALFVANAAQAAPCVYEGHVPTYVMCIAAQASDAFDIASSHGTAGAQQTSFTPSTGITSTSYVQLASLVVDTDGYSAGVALNAHTYVEFPAATTGRYEFKLAKTNCSGTALGASLWRPPTSSTTYVADPISLTGWDSASTGGTYVLCGRKFDVSAPDANAGHWGMVATW